VTNVRVSDPEQYRKLISSHEFAFHTAVTSGVRKRGRGGEGVEEKEH
jgi:hypothetical protein